MTNQKTTILQRKILRHLVIMMMLFYVVLPSTAPCRCLDCPCCKARTDKVNASCTTVCHQNNASCPCSAKKKSKDNLLSSNSKSKKSRLQKVFGLTTSFSPSATPCRCPCSKAGNLTKVTFIPIDDVRSTKLINKKDNLNLYKHFLNGRMLQICKRSKDSASYETPVSRLHVRLHLMLCVLLD